MSRSHALYVIAHENGVKLEPFGVDAATLIEVGNLAARYGQPSQAQPASNGRAASTPSAAATKSTPASRFASRDLHPRVSRASRKAYTSGLQQEAVRSAFQSVNNRVKRLTGSSRDGRDLMGWAFSDSPQLQVSDLATESTQNEHQGIRFMMQGAMTGIRNPRAHEDHWELDDDPIQVLELLGFASFLHRCLDRCESYAATS